MIEKKTIEVEVEKESHELGEFCEKLVVKVAECKFDDGELTSEEYAEIGLAAVTSATNAVEGVTEIADAEGAEYIDVTLGLAIPMTKAVKKVLALKKSFDEKAE